MCQSNLVSFKIVEDILFSLDNSAHIKDYKTGKYLNSNNITLKTFGYNAPDQMVGYTLWDLDSIMHKYWGKNFAKEVDTLDNQVGTKKTLVIDNNRVLVLPNGRINMHNVTKYPIIGSDSNVVGIFTVNKSIIQEMDIQSLFQLYKKTYCKNNYYATLYFLCHIGIDKYFVEMPTNSELNLLLAKFKNPFLINKQIASLLSISPRTIESHLSSLSDKLLKNISFVLSKISF